MVSQRENSPSVEKEAEHSLAAPDLKERVDDLERMVVLLLAASLRGRLLPADRKMIKGFLKRKAEKKRRTRSETPAQKGPTCPVCRLPIPDKKLERCPNCSVLLEVVGKHNNRES